MVWGEDGWPRLAHGGSAPAADHRRPRRCRPRRCAPPRRARTSTRRRCRSTSSGCARRSPRSCSASPRGPAICACSAARRIGSPFRQALVARRQQAHCFSARTLMEFEPDHYQQSAGLVCYYNASKFHYLVVSHDETLGRHIRVHSALPDGVAADAFTAPIPCRPGRSNCAPRWTRSGCASPGGRGGAWQWLPEVFDASILSDEAAHAGHPQLHRQFRGRVLPGHGRARRGRRISTGSNTSSATTAPMPRTEEFVTPRPRRDTIGRERGVPLQ